MIGSGKSQSAHIHYFSSELAIGINRCDIDAIVRLFATGRTDHCLTYARTHCSVLLDPLLSFFPEPVLPTAGDTRLLHTMDDSKTDDIYPTFFDTPTNGLIEQLRNELSSMLSEIQFANNQ